MSVQDFADCQSKGLELLHLEMASDDHACGL